MTSLRALLLLLLCSAVATAQGTGRHLAAPPVESTVAEDSLYFVNSDQERAWTHRVLRVEEDESYWVEVEDPFGGRILITDVFAIVLGERTRAFIDGTPTRSVQVGSTGSAIVSLALTAIGLLTVFAAPLVWLRRKLRRARARAVTLQETARQLAAGREEERKRLARELHDGPLQDLHALHMQLDVAAGALDGALGPDAVEARRLRGAQDEAHTVIGELRGIAEALRPPALGPFGLAAALRAHAERFGRQHPGVDVALALDDDGQALGEPVRIALFRVAQEAMTNAAKHASPSRVTVTLRLAAEAVTLTVEDDGAGYAGRADDPALVATGHFGLLGMRERADAIGGTLSIRDRNGGGTAVRIEVAIGAEGTALPS